MSVSVFAVKASSLSKYNSLDCIKASLTVARVPRRPFVGDCRNLLSSKLMGRTRPKTRKARPPAPELTESQRENKSEPAIEALLEKAQELIVQCDYDLAGKFVERVLKRAPDNVVGKEILGVAQLETGLLDAAKQVRFTHALQESRPAFSPAMLDLLIIVAAQSRSTISATTRCASIPCPVER
jgi:hypothetical protein